MHRKWLYLWIIIITLVPSIAHADSSDYRILIPYIDPPQSKSFESIADATQDFVRSNTVHSIDEEFYRHWHHPDIHVEKMLAYIKGDINKPLKAECSLRAEIFQHLMHEMGYETRYIAAYEHAKDVPTHAFSEVKNPQTGAWQVYDTAYGIHWKSTETGKRLSAKELLSLPFDKITPCRSGDICGWDKKSSENLKDPERLKGYIGALQITNLQTGERAPIMINTERFPIDTPVTIKTKTGLFCDFFQGACLQGVNIIAP